MKELHMKRNPECIRRVGLAIIGAAAILASAPAVSADENVLNIYSGIPRDQAEAVVAEFSKVYGKPVSAKVLDSAACRERLSAFVASGRLS